MTELAYALHDLVLTMDREAERLLAPLDLTYRRYLCLAIINEHPGLSGVHLTRPLQASEAAVSQLLKPLVTAGWVDAHSVPGRGHRRFLRLSDRGRALLDAANQALGSSFDDVVRSVGYDPEELAAVVQSIHAALRHPTPEVP